MAMWIRRARPGKCSIAPAPTFVMLPPTPTVVDTCTVSAAELCGAPGAKGLLGSGALAGAAGALGVVDLRPAALAGDDVAGAEHVFMGAVAVVVDLLGLAVEVELGAVCATEVRVVLPLSAATPAMPAITEEKIKKKKI